MSKPPTHCATSLARRKGLGMDPETLQRAPSFQPGSAEEERTHRRQAIYHQEGSDLPKVLQRDDVSKHASSSATKYPDAKYDSTKNIDHRRKPSGPVTTHPSTQPHLQSGQSKPAPVTIKSTVTPIGWAYPVFPITTSSGASNPVGLTASDASTKASSTASRSGHGSKSGRPVKQGEPKSLKAGPGWTVVKSAVPLDIATMSTTINSSVQYLPPGSATGKRSTSSSSHSHPPPSTTTTDLAQHAREVARSSDVTESIDSEGRPVLLVSTTVTHAVVLPASSTGARSSRSKDIERIKGTTASLDRSIKMLQNISESIHNRKDFTREDAHKAIAEKAKLKALAESGAQAATKLADGRSEVESSTSVSGGAVSARQVQSSKHLPTAEGSRAEARILHSKSRNSAEGASPHDRKGSTSLTAESPQSIRDVASKAVPAPSKAETSKQGRSAMEPARTRPLGPAASQTPPPMKDDSSSLPQSTHSHNKPSVSSSSASVTMAKDAVSTKVPFKGSTSVVSTRDKSSRVDTTKADSSEAKSSVDTTSSVGRHSKDGTSSHAKALHAPRDGGSDYRSPSSSVVRGATSATSLTAGTLSKNAVGPIPPPSKATSSKAERTVSSKRAVEDAQLPVDTSLPSKQVKRPSTAEPQRSAASAYDQASSSKHVAKPVEDARRATHTAMTARTADSLSSKDRPVVDRPAREEVVRVEASSLSKSRSFSPKGNQCDCSLGTTTPSSKERPHPQLAPSELSVPAKTSAIAHPPLTPSSASTLEPESSRSFGRGSPQLGKVEIKDNKDNTTRRTPPVTSSRAEGSLKATSSRGGSDAGSSSASSVKSPGPAHQRTSGKKEKLAPPTTWKSHTKTAHTDASYPKTRRPSTADSPRAPLHSPRDEMADCAPAKVEKVKSLAAFTEEISNTPSSGVASSAKATSQHAIAEMSAYHVLSEDGYSKLSRSQSASSAMHSKTSVVASRRSSVVSYATIQEESATVARGSSELQELKTPTLSTFFAGSVVGSSWSSVTGAEDAPDADSSLFGRQKSLPSLKGAYDRRGARGQTATVMQVSVGRPEIVNPSRTLSKSPASASVVQWKRSSVVSELGELALVGREENISKPSKSSPHKAVHFTTFPNASDHTVSTSRMPSRTGLHSRSTSSSVLRESPTQTRISRGVEVPADSPPPYTTAARDRAHSDGPVDQKLRPTRSMNWLMRPVVREYTETRTARCQFYDEAARYIHPQERLPMPFVRNVALEEAILESAKKHAREKAEREARARNSPNVFQRALQGFSLRKKKKDDDDDDAVLRTCPPNITWNRKD